MKESFGTRFARLRKDKKLTQEELAEKVNVSPQAVSKWENDMNMPDVGLLLSLAETLGTTVDELLGKEPPAPAVYAPEKARKEFSKLMLRIYVDTAAGDTVRCNFPLSLVKLMMESGMAPTVSGSGKINDAMNDVDWKQLYAMVEQGVLGEIMTVDTADGDKVRIVVE